MSFRRRPPGAIGRNESMTADEIDQIVACLPRGKTVFHYFADRYAVLLLGRLMREPTRVADLKRSSLDRLLRRPLVAELLRRCADGLVEPDLFRFAWAEPAEPYLLGLGRWGEERRHPPPANYHQTSRPGLNLVLQLNTTSRHDRPCGRWVVPRGDHPFVYPGHPVAIGTGRTTLAWARLDIALDDGEALIEEIQSDWVREAQQLMRNLASCRSDAERDAYLRDCCESISLEGVRRYAATVLPFHARFWAEAMLTAAIWFLRDELGVRRIYFHTYDGGNRLKGLDACFAPPRSLYTDLPRRFCFAQTAEPPRLLERCSDWRVRAAVRSREIAFFRLQL